MAAPLALLAGYLSGSIPFGLFVARCAAGIDPREHGSRNIGATNIARTLGMKWGGLVLALDALKGLLPVLILPPLLLARGDAAIDHLRVGCGLAAVCGHMFPCWLGFRGGKGVATALGVVCVLAPWPTLAAFLAFAATFAATRYVSASSILAAIVFAGVQLVMLAPNPFSAAHWSLAAFSLAVPVLIIVRHRANIVRLWRGEEAKLGRSSAAQPSATAEEPPAEG
ncbi:MAG: glycerol-3-phosphate 1-O-acyltransferase [Planctomycetota bacterium]|nr:MAG: glycerol-3-phosphate 1-O-acyltransferase [Planctomycetota bacterium]REJ90603.1 MAG: glycerol-3-phosphate 1-O-acyltransferase [Planctomycetota bacterium]REK30127.1 MAG: glycerol-3-phosphate 1-O-acyltransferase [Planctomycetota bacterium]REK37765.1 MAG: glycerol-3-phosphate 1-O-acyltransferase [Planctomycetota bacterium]